MSIDVQPDRSGLGCFHCGGHRNVRFVRITAMTPVRDPEGQLTRFGKQVRLRLCRVCLGEINARLTVTCGVEPSKCGSCEAVLEQTGGCPDCGTCADCGCLPDCPARLVGKEV